MSQNLPPLIPQEQTPTFNLGATKYGIVNPIYNAIKNIVPVNARLLSRSLFTASPVTEQNFSPEELSLLKQTYLNSLDRTNTEYAKNWQPRLKELSLNKKRNESDEMEYQYAMNRASPTIQYADYPHLKKYDKYDITNMPIRASFEDKGYGLTTALGRANYYTDPQGNVHITDTYNFPNSKVFNDYSSWNPSLKLANAIGEKFSKPMPIDINLGQIRR